MSRSRMHQQKCKKEKAEQEKIKGLSNIRAGCTDKSVRKKKRSRKRSRDLAIHAYGACQGELLEDSWYTSCV